MLEIPYEPLTVTVGFSPAPFLVVRHVLDIVGVQCGEDRYIHRRTVEDEQRRVRRIDGVDTAQTHRNRSARLTGTGVHLQTGNLALQGITGTGRRNLGESVRPDQGRSADHRADLLGSTVTDHNGLLQHLCIVTHDDVDDTAAGHLHGLRDHTNIRESQPVIGPGADGIFTRRARSRILAGSFIVDGNTDQRFIPGIGHCAGHRAGALCKDRDRDKQQDCQDDSPASP